MVGLFVTFRVGFVCLFGCNSCFKFFTYELTERQTINSARNVLQANDFHHIDVHSHILMHIVYHLFDFLEALRPRTTPCVDCCVLLSKVFKHIRYYTVIILGLAYEFGFLQ